MTNITGREIKITSSGDVHPAAGIRTSVFFYICISVLLSLLLPAPFAPAVSAETAPLVKSVEIEGNRKISESTIRAKMKSRVGEPFSKNTVQDDIKRLYRIGYFDNIRVEIDPFEGGVKLIYIFMEKPTIVDIDFQGNEEFENDDLREKITITSGAISNLSLINDNVGKIVSFYQSEGYWLTEVVPVLREISDDAVALTFQIHEGPKVVIESITIENNSALTDKEIKKAMQTKERWFLSFITGSGIYKKEQIQADIGRIRELYHSRGYITVAVSEPEIRLSEDKEELHLTISVSEGDQFSVKSVDVEGNTAATNEEIFGLISVEPGRVFNRTALRNDIDNIIDLYMERGYARVDVNPVVDINAEDNTVNVTFSITEGGIFRIGRINISGNIKTRDKVIRREVRLDEGEIFNNKLIKRSFQRINNLNYFESIDIAPAPRVEEQLIDLDIKVKEKLTGMLSIGGGYSSIDKVMVMGELTQTNLFGKGYHLKLRADLSARRANYKISLVNPWFMDRPVSASFSMFNEVLEYPDYDKQATGGSFGLGKEFSEYVGGKIVYDLEQVEISDVSADASSLIKDQIGSKLTSSISPSIWKDTRDNYMDPTRGSRAALYTTFAGLGGDNYFVKGLVDYIRYFPSIADTTFSLRGRFGYATGFAGKKLPLYERFYVGGINTVRGLDFGEGGPRDDEGEVIGGNKELIFNAEYIIPILKDMNLKGVLFYDYGASFDKDDNISLSDMRQTTGAGLRWLSPFGPIRIEWGFNLDPKEDESSNKIEFSMGGFF